MRDRIRSNDRPVDSQLDPEEEQKLYTEQLKVLCSNIPASSIATLVCSSILIFILWKVISPAVLIPWLGCLFLVTFLRYLLALRYKRSPAEPRESARRGVRLIAGITAVGLVWGAAGIFLFAGGSPVHQVFLIFVLGGMIAGSLGSYSVVRRAFPAFAIPASLPVIIHSIIQGGKIEIAMGALALLFVVIMLVVSRRMRAAIVKSLRLQFENTGLIANLTAAKEAAEKTGKELRGEISIREQTEDRLRHREKFERIINTISTEFINIKADELDGGITRALKRVGEEVGADRSYLFLFDMDRMTMDNTHEWCAGGIEPQIDNLQGIPFETLPWWMEKLNRLEDIHIPRVSDLPPEAGATKTVLQAQAIRSLIVVPLIYGGSLIGFLGFDSVQTERSWPEETIGRLRIVGEIFANALKHQEADDQIKERARELSVLNRVIVAASAAGDLTTLLKNILDSTLELLDFDGGGIYLVDEAEREAELRCSKGLNPEFLEEVRRVKIDEEPYATVFIRKQSIITDNYQRVSPGHSERSGLLSLASLPIFSKDRVIGAINVGSKKRYSFNPQEIEILKAIVRETESALSRMRAEDSRRESEGRFRAVFETARDCIFIKDTRLKYVQVNPAMEELFELPASKIIGLTDDKLFGREAGEHIKKADLRVLKGEIVDEEHTKPVRGIETTFHVVKVPMRDSSGEIIGLCGIARDITERKEWEERITYLSLAAERMGEMVIVTDLNHIVTYANPAVEVILGYKLEEIIGRDSRDFFKGVPGNPPDLVQCIKDQETTGIWRGELFNRRKDGAIIKIHLTLSPLKDRSGTLLGYVGVSLDITERERLEAELRHAQKMEAIGTLAGGLAHDFNNILAGIMGYAFLTRKGLPEGSAYIPDMETIEKLAQRGSDLTGSLLTLARRGEYRPEPLNITQLIEEVLNVIKVSLGKEIDFQITISPDLSNILGDRGQIHQVIMNLCINACEAMPEGGVLTVRSSNFLPDPRFFNRHPGLRIGNYIYLEISDTGVGMDTGTKTRIFDPFFTTKAEKSGTGLGLSVVNGIIEKHKGLILVESEPGRGSVFRLYLPATEQRIKEKPPVSVEAFGGEETILVVDDEKEVRESTVRWLQKLGYTVFEAKEGEEALKVLEKRKDEIDLVLLDMIMREMGGAETYQRMRKIIPALPIIICSGYSLGDDIRRLIEDGTGGFIRKPYAPEELARKIREVLGSTN